MNDVTKFENMAPSYERPMSALEIKAQVLLIQEVMREVMIAGVHYGYPPGTEPKNDEERKNKKPSLYKAGAEKLCLVFRLDPQYDAKLERDGNHLSVVSTCTLYSIATGRRVGSGMGSGTTRESKHAYRWSVRTCPSCKAEAIIKGRAEFGGGYLCYAKKGGCGAKFKDDDPAIVEQHAGKVENPDVADQHNTVLKMANKRALVAGTLTATAASDIFNQDIEDLGEEAEWIDEDGVVHQGKPNKEQRRKPQQSQSRSQGKQGEQAGAGAGNGEAKASPGLLKNIENKLKALAESTDGNVVDLTAACMKEHDITALEGITDAKAKEIQAWIRQKQSA